MMGLGRVRRRRRLGRALFVIVIVLFVLGVLIWQVRPRSLLLGGRNPVVPTSCPDPVACHALKRLQPTAGTE